MNMNNLIHKTAIKPVTRGLMALLIGMGLFSTQAQAKCSADKGAQIITFDFNKNITDPSQNEQGTELLRTFQWNLPLSYQGTCIDAGELYYKATVPGLSEGIKIGNLNYYHFNQYLQVATEIWISGNRNAMVPTPFIDTSNYREYPRGAGVAFGTGGRGTVSLYFTRAFVGEVSLPRTLVAELFATTAAAGATKQYGPAIARVYMEGKVIVPQSCSINAGQVINVDFGRIAGRSFSQKGSSPTEYTPRNVNINLACKNISEGVQVSLSFSGQAAEGDATALASSNKDIGIRVLNASGQTVVPNQSELPVLMNYASQSGSTSMTVAPINLTGSVPDPGPFNAVATVNVEIQ